MATADGSKTTSTLYGTCIIDNMTTLLSFFPYTGKYIDIAPDGSYLLSGSYEAGSYGYELTFCSITDRKIILEIKKIYDSTYGSDTVTTNYDVFDRS
jgi:hypothetical protein